MKKLKIYLDTYVMSHLEAPDRPDWMAETRKLWDIILTGKFDVFILPQSPIRFYSKQMKCWSSPNNI